MGEELFFGEALRLKEKLRLDLVKINIEVLPPNVRYQLTLEEGKSASRELGMEDCCEARHWDLDFWGKHDSEVVSLSAPNQKCGTSMMAQCLA